MRTPEDLVVQTFRTIIVSEVESSIPVLVLDYKFNSHIARPGAHGFQLERGVVAREHAAIVVARVVDEAAGFLLIKGEALAKYPGRLSRSSTWISYLSVWPGSAVPEALGLNALGAKGEYTGNGSENWGRLHFACRLGELSAFVFCDSDRLGDSIEDNRAKKTYESKRDASFIHSLDINLTWSPSVLQAKKDFFVSCSASHGMASFRPTCYKTLPPFTPCRASYTNLSLFVGCSQNVRAVLRTRTAPSQAFNARAVYSDARL